jgi:hypothetical protein
MQGSVAIQGAIGIGKSSILSQLRMSMEGFLTSHKAVSAIAVGTKDIKTVDDAARLILESFADVDEKSEKIKFKFGSFVEIESAEVCRYFSGGRHLAGLIRLLEKKNMDMLFNGKELLILAIDEADKCAIPIARLIRALTTHLQQAGVKRIRFVLAGVSPYFQQMVDEDAGVSRFFYKVITLAPMERDDSIELVTTKLQTLVKSAETIGLEIRVDPVVIERIVALSGGHPHILQLMGSHVVEHENNDSDNIINSRDLANSLRTICYEDRNHVYESTLHSLELHNQLDTLRELLAIASTGFPTHVNKARALHVAGIDSLKWFVTNNILVVREDGHYGLLDEFLRIRMLLDDEDADSALMEERVLLYGNISEIGSLAINMEEGGDEDHSELIDEVDDDSPPPRQAA